MTTQPRLGGTRVRRLARALRHGACAASLAAAPVWADTLVLKNGSRFQGTVVRETDAEVTIKTAAGDTTFKRGQIRSIKKDAAGAEGPASPDAAAAVPPAGEPDLDLASLPQSLPVTIEARDESVFDVMAEIERQSGAAVTGLERGSDAKRITLSLRKAPLWEALLAAGRPAGVTDLGYVQEGGRVKIDLSPWQPQKRAAPPSYDVRGPFLFIWDGLVEDKEFDFSQSPPQTVDRAWMRLRLMIDPATEVNIEPNVNPPITFYLPGGRAVTLTPDHEVQTEHGGRLWKFALRDELKPAPVRVEGRVPVWTATQEQGATVEARALATVRSGDVTLTVQSLKQTGDEIALSAFLICTPEAREGFAKEQQALWGSIHREHRQPSAEEQRKLKSLEGAAALAARRMVLTGAAGPALEAPARSANGFSGPPIGYTFQSTFRVPDGFVPKSVTVRYQMGYRCVDVPFRIEAPPPK